MTQEHNPQAEQMADESMARNLGYQAQATWPQEQALFDRYGLSGVLKILDIGCGTGEITRRLAQRYPQAQLFGVDILDANLARARRDTVDGSDRISYQPGDAYALTFPDAHFDLVVCRHMSQAVPEFPRVLKELGRVLKPGGWLHLLTEDYGMLHMATPGFDSDLFWNQHALTYLRRMNCDAHIGRHSPALLERAGYQNIAMDFLTVDTMRVPRAIFSGIITAWRDGYSSVLADATGRNSEDVAADFNKMIYAIETPPHYAVWHVPVVSGRKLG